MAIRFIRPETSVLPLSGGDTITVRRRLSHGDQQDAFGRMYTTGADGEAHRDPVATGTAMVVAFLLDWTQKDDPDFTIKGLSPDEVASILRHLEPESFREIKAAIEAHELRMLAERNAEKNGQGGGSNEPATSPSPSAAAGESSGSAT